MTSIQTYIGSAYSSYPVRWIESPEASRSRSEIDKLIDKKVEKAADPDIGKPKSASGDVLDISPQAQKSLESSRSESKTNKTNLENDKSDSKQSEQSGEAAELTAESAGKPQNKSAAGTELTPEELKQVERLKSIDQEIRTHELAHLMAGGAFVTGGPSYTYEVGPDGKGYATAGSVGIDTSPVQGDPEATIAKMQTVVAAALAPAKPSGQDQKVAAAARQTEAKARAELAQKKPQEQSEQSESSEQAEESGTPMFSVVRSADKVAKDAADASQNSTEKSAVRSYAASSSEFSPRSAYQAQSVQSLLAPNFSAFA